MKYPLVCVLLAVGLVCVGVAEQNLVDEAEIRLEQSMFSPPSQREHLLATISFRSQDGRSRGVSVLAPEDRQAIHRMTTQIIPRIEFSDADPRDVISFLARAAGRSSPPIQMSRIIMEKPQHDVWVSALDIGNTRITCTLTNVSVLDFSIVLAEVLDQEVGLMEDGSLIFGRENRWRSGFVPAYTIQRSRD